MRLTTVLATAIVLGAAPAFAQAARGGGFEVRTLSTRADMVSGGDVLIQIAAPPSSEANVAITVNGHEPNAELKATTPATTLIARLKDLRLGPNLIEVGVITRAGLSAGSWEPGSTSRKTSSATTALRRGMPSRRHH